MIRLKKILLEQPGATIKAKPETDAEKNQRLRATVTPFNAAKVADLIYNAKGYFLDDEEFAKLVIRKNIKNAKNYVNVNKELQKLSGGQGMGAYLRSFMQLDDRIDIIGHLMEVLPRGTWDWSIKAIVPWEDLKYVKDDPKYASAWDTSGLSGLWTGGTAERNNVIYKLSTDVYSDQWKQREQELWDEFKHNALDVSELVTAFIPVIGPALSAGIGLTHAKLYADEGDTYSAGLYVLFAALPGGSKLMAKAAGKLGIKNWLKRFGAKLKLKKGPLSKEEKLILSSTSKNKDKLKKAAQQQTKKQGAIRVAKRGAKAVRETIKQMATGFVAVSLYDIAYYQAMSITPEEFETAIANAEAEEMQRFVAQLKQSATTVESVKISEQVQKRDNTTPTSSDDGGFMDLLSAVAWDDMLNFGTIALTTVAFILGRKFLGFGGDKGGGDKGGSGKFGKRVAWPFRTLYDLLKVTFTAGKRGTQGLKTQFGIIITRNELDMLVQSFRQDRQQQYRDVVANIANGTWTAGVALENIKKQTVFKKNLKRYESALENAFAELETLAASSPAGTSNTPTPAKPYTGTGKLIGFKQPGATVTVKRKGGATETITFPEITQDEYDALPWHSQMWLDNLPPAERKIVTIDQARRHSWPKTS